MNDQQNRKRELTPKLRFSEFQDAGEWTMDLLGNKNISEFINLRVALEQLNIDTYVSTENLLPDYAGVARASKLPPSGSFTRYKKGDVLVSNIRPYLKKVWSADKDGASSNDVVVIRSGKKVTSNFLTFILKNDQFINYVMIGAKGVKMPRGDIASIKEYPVAFPMFAEQQKIADCLSSIDELITLETQKLDTLKTHKKGLMQELFPAEGETLPKLRFPEFRDAGEWEDDKLGSVCELYQPVTLSASELSMTGKYLVYGANGIIGTHDEYNHEESEIAVTCRGATCGEVTITEPRSWITGNAMVVKPRTKDLRKDFVFQYFKNHGLKSVISGSAQPQITRAGFSPLVFFFPEPAEQQKIADCLSSIDELITAQAQKLDTLKTHKKGLMQQLFPALDEGPG